ncbi:MAG TPA: glycosyltransferase [Bacteroidetes bacterium]|nr:glycosyltransferase [Bacteroidota bacterium]
MNILILIKRFDFGGAENHARELANRLVEKGHRVILVAGKGRQQKQLRAGVRYFPMQPRDLLWPFQLIFLIALALYYRIHVIHAHQRLPILMAGFAGKITRTRVVSTVHGRTRYDLRSGLARRCSDSIIFVSRRVLEVSAAYEEISHKAVVIPNGIQIQAFSHRPHDFVVAHTCRLDRNHADLLGMLMEQVIPLCAGRFASFSYCIYGDGPYRNELEKRAEETNAKTGNTTVEMKGYMENVVPCYENASLVVGVGRVALEAMAHGIPVLCMNNKHLGGIITSSSYNKLRNWNFVDVNAPPPTPQEVFRRLNACFQNRAYWQKEALNLKRCIEKDHDHSSLTERTLQVYAGNPSCNILMNI